MKHYYIPADNERGFTEVTESAWKALLGDATSRPYVGKVYRGELTIEDVPDGYRAAVSAVVDRRVAQWGTYTEQVIPAEELQALTQGLMRTVLTRSGAQALMNGVARLREGASDAMASAAVYAYPQLNGDGSLIPAGTRINWKASVRKAAVDLWDTEQNNPDNAPTLWEDMAYRDGCRLIPDVITATGAFALNECGWWNGVLYRSKMSGNTYTPGVMPDMWEAVDRKQAETIG